MEQKIYRIKPVFEERMWGGQHLIEKYHYQTELKNIAESYCCIAIPNHLDCDVIDTGDKLSDFYHQNRELFGSDTDDIPIRLTVESVLDNMSVQIHPEDEYALEHFHQYGKPGGILYLEGTPTDLLLGHHAKTKEEFIQWNETRQFDKLFRFVDYVPGDFIHIPANTLHSFRIRGIMIAFARNSDVTLRLYDYDRMDPKTGKPRKMHVKEVYENVTIPVAVRSTGSVSKWAMCCLFPRSSGRSTWPEIWTSCTAPIKTNRSTSGDTAAAWLGIPTISKQTSRLFSFLIDFV